MTKELDSKDHFYSENILGTTPDGQKVSPKEYPPPKELIEWYLKVKNGVKN